MNKMEKDKNTKLTWVSPQDPGDEDNKLVPYDFKYHAEIMYETQESFNFDRAVGNTLEEIIKEIKGVLIYRKDRNPKIRTVLYDPNNENIDITRKILTLIEPHTKGVNNGKEQTTANDG